MAGIEEVGFSSRRSSEKITLDGRLHVPQGATAGGVVLCHPHPAGGGRMGVPLLVYLAERIASAGYACLRFDFGGVGASSGPFTDGIEETGDVAAAFEFLCGVEQVDSERVALAGWSFGAWMSVLAVADGVPARSLAAIAPPLAGYRWDEVAGRVAASTAARRYIVGDRDGFCPVEDLMEFTRAVSAGEPERVTVLAGADHFLSGFEDEVAREVLSAIQE